MKIALFSDVHANLPALEACLQNIENQKVDAVYCLGDLVGYNVWPNEVIDKIRNRRIPVIAGNYDFGIARRSDDCGCAYKEEHEKEMGKISISYTNSVIKEDQKNYLRTLPAHIHVEYKLNEDSLFLLMVHGSPRKINEYLFEDRDEKSMMRIMETYYADVMLFGHTHKPYHRVFEYIKEGVPAYRHAINIGSVGKPKDGDPRGCYVILTINKNTSKRNRESIHVEFIRFEYDIEKAVEAIKESILPDEYAEMLRKGK